MNKATLKNKVNYHLDIGSEEPKNWGGKEIEQLRNQAKELAQQRSEEQKLKNELMAIRFEIEEYLENNNHARKVLTLDKLIGMYLDVLNMPFRRFAMYLDTTDGNLRKYLTGERKLSTDLALKFGHFFHTSPEIWLRLQLKNEILDLKKERKEVKRYEKYDYLKAIKL